MTARQLSENAIKDHGEEIVDERRIPVQQKTVAQIPVVSNELVRQAPAERRSRRCQCIVEPLVETRVRANRS